MDYHSKTRASRGFSVIELMAVLAVIALITSAAVPALIAFSHRTTLRSEAAAVRLFLERAYSYTLTAQERVDVIFSEHELTARKESGAPLSEYQLKHGVSVRLNSSQEKIVTLYPSISASPQTIDLTKGSQLCSVVASLRGRFRTTC